MSVAGSALPLGASCGHTITTQHQNISSPLYTPAMADCLRKARTKGTTRKLRRGYNFIFGQRLLTAANLIYSVERRVAVVGALRAAAKVASDATW